MKRIRACIKNWTEYDAQFDLMDGIFTIAPTSVFLAINAGREAYAKLSLCKDGSPAACSNVSPSALLLEFMKEHPDVNELLDPNTISIGIDGVISAIHLPQVWAQPIPGGM